MRTELAVRSLSGGGDWSSTGPASLASIEQGNPFALDFITRGQKQGSDYSKRDLYRIELYPTGVPTWIDEFDADTANDPVRTYGLGRLFTLFSQLAEHSPAPAARIYAVVN